MQTLVDGVVEIAAESRLVLEIYNLIDVVGPA